MTITKRSEYTKAISYWRWEVWETEYYRPNNSTAAWRRYAKHKLSKAQRRAGRME